VLGCLLSASADIGEEFAGVVCFLFGVAQLRLFGCVYADCTGGCMHYVWLQQHNRLGVLGLSIKMQGRAGQGGQGLWV
jgi:hypothetical protein